MDFEDNLDQVCPIQTHVESTSSCAFVLPASELAVPSTLPSHIEERLERASRVDDSRLDRMKRAELRREELLRHRRERLTQRHTAMKERMDSFRSAGHEATTHARAQLEASLENAAMQRSRILRRRQLRSRATVERAQAMALGSSLLSTKRPSLSSPTILPPLDVSPFLFPSIADCTTAATTLQRWWRLRCAVRSLSRLDVFQQRTFDDMAQLINSRSVVEAAHTLVKLIADTSNNTNTATIATTTTTTATTAATTDTFKRAKQLLTATLIVSHPNEVMSQPSRTSARLLRVTATHLAHLFASHRFDATSFVCAWHSYLARFTHWRNSDANDLVQSLMAHHVELGLLQLTTASNDAAAAEWHPHIQSQLSALRKRIGRLGGEQAVRETVRQTECAFEKRRLLLEQQRQQVIEEELRGTLLETMEEKEQKEVENDAVDMTMRMSEETLSALRALQCGNEKMAIAHEVAVNPGFTLRHEKKAAQQGEVGLEERVREGVTRAFWVQFEEQLARGDTRGVLSLVDTLRSGLVDVSPASARDGLCEHLDSALIEQQQRHGCLDCGQLMRYCVERMLEVCAPVRDSALKTLLLDSATYSSVVGRWRVLMELLEEMRVDMAEHRLRESRPLLLAHAAEYEQAQIARLIESGVLSLRVTREWVHSMRAAQGSAEGGAKEVRYVVAAGVLDMVVSGVPADDARVPESLWLDRMRLRSAHTQFQLLVTVATLAATGLSALEGLRPARERRLFLDKLKETLLVHPSQSADETALVALKCALAALPQQEPLAPVLTRILTNLFTQGVTGEGAARPLVLRHARAHLEQTAKVSSTSPIECVAEELGALVRDIRVLTQHNWAVFGEYYNTM